MIRPSLLDSKLNDIDSHLLQEANSHIPTWVDAIQYDAPDKVCRNIYDMRFAWGLYSLTHDQAIQNIEKCLDQISNWHQSQAITLSSVPEQLAHHFHNRSLVGPSSPDTSDTVQLMTIHHSKGLEFPVVFLPNLDKAFNFNASDTLLNSRQFGAALSFKYDEATSPWRQELAEKIKAQSLWEELRPFYVACTRVNRI